MESILFWKNYFMLLKRLHLKPGPRPWTRTLKNLDPEKSGPWKSLTWKTMTQKKLDPEKSGPEKPGPWKIWILKNLGYEKRRKQLDAEKQIRRPHGIIYWILKSAKKRLVSQSNSEGFLISVWFVLFHHTSQKSHLKWIWSGTFWSGIDCFSRILSIGQKVFYIKKEKILCLIFLTMYENSFQQTSRITFSFLLKI